jgi:hypothetical protein
MNDRDIKEKVGKAFRRGDLTIKRIDGKVEKEIKNCSICGKEIEDLGEFAYLVINNPDAVNVDEKIFCTRKCWEEFLRKETSDKLL